MERFKAGSVDVRGLSRKEAAKKRRLAYMDFRIRKGIEDVCTMETSRNERNAWKVRSYMANKMRQ